MSVLGWLLLAALAATAMMAASRWAVRDSVALARLLGLSPFLVGLTLVTLGTDAPEVVNSLVSCYLGHPDINVGDSLGSVYTQAALILGLFPFATRVAQPVPRREILVLGVLTAVALGLCALLLHDGRFARGDAGILAGSWAVLTFLAARLGAPMIPHGRESGPSGRAVLLSVRALGAFAIVALAATLLVKSVSALSVSFGVPEFVLGFFLASLGTSLPELVTEVTALRRGESQLALGNVLGACLMDASLSISLGPLFFPSSIDGQLAWRGVLVAGGAVGVATMLLGLRGVHDRRSGLVLVLVYLVAYAFLARS